MYLSVYTAPSPLSIIHIAGCDEKKPFIYLHTLDPPNTAYSLKLWNAHNVARKLKTSHAPVVNRVPSVAAIVTMLNSKWMSSRHMQKTALRPFFYFVSVTFSGIFSSTLTRNETFPITCPRSVSTSTLYFPDSVIGLKVYPR